MTKDEVVIRPEWTFYPPKNNSHFSFECGIVAGRYLYLRQRGVFEGDSMMPLFACIERLLDDTDPGTLSSILIFDCESADNNNHKSTFKRSSVERFIANEAYERGFDISDMVLCNASSSSLESDRLEYQVLEEVFEWSYVFADNFSQALQLIQGCDLDSHRLASKMGEMGRVHEGDDFRAYSNEKLEHLLVEQDALLDNIITQVWYLKDEQTYGAVNKAHAEFLGLTVDDVRDRNIYDFLPQEVACKCEMENKAVWKERSPISIEAWVPDSRGAIKYLSIRKAPVFDSNGNLKYVVCSAEDITDKKLARDDLEKKEESFRDILNSVSEAIYVLDKNGVFLTVNKGAERMYGYTREELCGKTPVAVSAEGKNDLQHVGQCLQAAYERKEESTFEFWGVRKNGEEFLKEVIVKGGTYEGNQVVLATARDISEVRKQQIALKDTEERLRLVLENSRDIIILIDDQERISFINESDRLVYGYSSEEILFAPASKFLDADDLEVFRHHIQETKRNRDTVKFESRICHKNGSRIDVEFATKAVEHRGEIVIQTSIHDISKRKRAESERQYQFGLRRLLMELSSTFINIPLEEVDDAIKDGLKKLCNFVGADRSYMFNYDFRKQSISLISGHNNKSQHSMKDQLQQIPLSSVGLLWRTHLGNQILEIEDVETLEDSESVKSILKSFDVRSIIAVPMMVGGVCEGFLGFDSTTEPHSYTEDEKEMMMFFAEIMSNVRERINYESTQAKLKKAVEQNPSTIIITDSDGLIEYINPEGLKLFGYKEEEIIGEKPRILKSNFTDDATYEEMWSRLSLGKSWKGEICNSTKSGENVWENVTISPILDNKGEVANFVAVEENITTSKKLIHDLQKAKDKAEQSDQLKSAFLANMSHEIRTPLNGILGFAALLEDDSLTPDLVKEYTSVIQHSGNHLLNIINDIIHVSKLDAGYIKAVPETVDVSELMGELCEVYRGRVESNAGSVDIQLDLPEKAIVCKTDPTRLRQVLENLLGNALKFTTNGYIRMGARVEADKVLFSIKDSGIGVSQEKLETIFERFTQASENTEKLYGGTGLGLSISKSCVELLGGEISVESELGKGSTFHFDINFEPIEEIDSTESQLAPTSRAIEFNQEHVLIAEDDDVGFQLIEKMLIKKNLKVSRCLNGREVLRLVKEREKDFDVILMDIGLPEVSGFEATQAIRKMKSEIPIIAQTALAFEDDREKCMQAGCDDYLAKPIDAKSLYEAISAQLG